MALSYVAIDFETANSHYSSACSVGLTKVCNSQIVDTYYSLINPEEPFDASNIQIHGIRPDDVTEAPTFDRLSNHLFRFIANLPLVAHNAPFDMKVLQKSLGKYDLDFPIMNYFCSLALSRQLLQLRSNRLNSVAANYHIQFHHHRASDDSRVCAEIVLQMLQEADIHNLEEMTNKLHYQMGLVGQNDYRAFRKMQSGRYPYNGFKPSEITAKTSVFDPFHPVYHHVFVFSGSLRTMDRMAACQKVADLGGINGNSVTKKTNYLVVGDQDPKLLRGHTKSSKQIKAEQLAEQGQNIQIITETEFLKLL